MRPSEGPALGGWASRSWSWLVPLAIGAPLLAAVAFMAVVTLSAATGVGPFKPDPPRNPSEALILSDPASAVWMFRTGADPAAIYEVRLELLASGMEAHLRPLVAAAYTGDEDMVGLALREGASLPPDEARTAACRLSGRGLETISRMLAPPAWSPEACQAGDERDR